MEGSILPATGERAVGAATMAEAFRITAADHADRVALRTKDDELSLTWGELAERVDALAGGLHALGVRRGDRVGLMIGNRPEFHIADLAVTTLGAAPFSVYLTSAPEQVAYVVDDAAADVMIVEAAFESRVPVSVKHTVVVERWDDLLVPGFDSEAHWRAVQPDDILTLIYTSGTTGPPKGVQIAHRNEMAAGRSFDQIIQFPEGARVVSYLPMAHIAERSCSQSLPILFGFTVTDCPNAREVIGYLPEVRPTWFFSVPRIFEKLKAAVEAGIAAEEDEQKKQASEWAIGVGLRKVRAEQAGEEVPDDLAQEFAKADEMVLSKIREKLGLNELEAMNVGAAPTPRE